MQSWYIVVNGKPEKKFFSCFTHTSVSIWGGFSAGFIQDLRAGSESARTPLSQEAFVRKREGSERRWRSTLKTGRQNFRPEHFRCVKTQESLRIAAQRKHVCVMYPGKDEAGVQSSTRSCYSCARAREIDQLVGSGRAHRGSIREPLSSRQVITIESN